MSPSAFHNLAFSCISLPIYVFLPSHVPRPWLSTPSTLGSVGFFYFIFCPILASGIVSLPAFWFKAWLRQSPSAFHYVTPLWASHPSSPDRGLCLLPCRTGLFFTLQTKWNSVSSVYPSFTSSCFPRPLLQYTNPSKATWVRWCVCPLKHLELKISISAIEMPYNNDNNI